MLLTGGGGVGTKAPPNLNLSLGRAAIGLPEARAEGRKQPDRPLSVLRGGEKA